MRNGKQHGFTYLSLIILVAIIGLASAATIKLGSIMQRSAAERELLAIGAEYADALESYAKATPPGQSPLPPSFKELLRDNRFPNVRRHLRRVYVDPLTGNAEWGIVYANQVPGALPVPLAAGAMPGAAAGAPPGTGA
ncbi:type II secretion system protein, partial [Pseudoduganella ginsengisoli]|uniref:type II secretion system protein n=1 Tax=Pseudoduganella ginsengisoli TaxID=1462440 RepID=UPI001BA7E41C